MHYRGYNRLTFHLKQIALVLVVVPLVVDEVLHLDLLLWLTGFAAS